MGNFHFLILVFSKQEGQTQSYPWNLFDFDFFYYITLHEKLKLPTAIKMGEELAKVYLKNHIYA
jgi:hypothetical protein